MPALTRSEARTASTTRDERLVVFFDVFHGHPANVEDWGTARTPAAQQATLKLFEAVARCDLPAVNRALEHGACPNARLNDLMEWPREGKASPPLRTPLDLAWWRQSHTAEGQPVYGTLQDDHVRDLGLVSALLKAGAVPNATWLRHLHGEDWNVCHHPAFEACVKAVLDRLGQPGPLPEGLSIVPETRTRLTAQDRVAGAVRTRPAELWLHRAIQEGHWSAVHGWFDRGGAVGVLDGDGALSMLWEATLHRAPPQRGPYVDQRAVFTAIDRAQGLLMRAPDALYRQEIMMVMKYVARPLAMAIALDRDAATAAPHQHEAGHRCLDWLVDRMMERPLSSMTPTADEAKWLGTETAFVTELGRGIERLVLQRTVANSVTTAPAERVRARL